MDALVDQGTSAIELEGAAPAGVSVVFRRPIPLHASVRQQGFAEHAVIDPVFPLADMRFHAVLKDHAEFDASPVRHFDEFVGAASADIDRLFR